MDRTRQWARARHANTGQQHNKGEKNRVPRQNGWPLDKSSMSPIETYEITYRKSLVDCGKAIVT
jgi:hypothetical protein